MFVNQSSREINLKLIYVGPPGDGPIQNLRHAYGLFPVDNRGAFVTVDGEAARTSFFDVLPPGLGEIRGFRVRLHLYAMDEARDPACAYVPLLKGSDGLVFVAPDDASSSLAAAWVQQALEAHGRAWATVPTVLQIDQRGAAREPHPDALALASRLGLGSESVVRARTEDGTGVMATVKAGLRALLLGIKDGRVQAWEPSAAERASANWMMARVQLVGHYREFFGEGVQEYGPFERGSGRAPWYVMLHPASVARPHATYATFGLSVEPQPSGGRLELLAFTPTPSEAVLRRFVDVAMFIARSGPDEGAFTAYDTIATAEPGHDAHFVLAPPEEGPGFEVFPDQQRQPRDVLFTQAVGARADHEAQVTFLQVFPLSRDEAAFVAAHGAPSLLRAFAGKPKGFGWGRDAGDSVLR